MHERRWLSAIAAAEYLDVRVDALPRYVKAGKLPKPDYTLGPKTARYDKLLLDKAMGSNDDSAISNNVDVALEKWREKFEKEAKGKDRAA